VSYTFSKSLNNAPGFSALTVTTKAFPQDTRNLRAERSFSKLQCATSLGPQPNQ
jgi:hypothetical protein